MKFQLPLPLIEAPPPRPPWEDFKLLLAAQWQVAWNKMRHWPKINLIAMIILGLGVLALLVFLGKLAYGALVSVPPQIGRGFLSLIFMAGFAGLLFFGVTSAFATLYMSDDLELLFMAPVPTRVVFAAKLLAVAGANFFTAALFIFIPGLFYGLLLKAGPLFYLWVVLAGLGLWATGTALAGLLNLLIMRIVPPHRSREAVGVLGAVAGLMIALIFQIPNLVTSGGGRFDLSSWLSGQQPLITAMDYFPWGWGSLALAGSASGNQLAGLGWSLLLLLLGTGIYLVSFLLVERGFRRGWISLGQGEGRRFKRRSARVKPAGRVRTSVKTTVIAPGEPSLPAASSWLGMWAIAKKDLLYLRRDTREWFGLITPLILVAFFVGQFLFLPGDSSRTTLVTVLIMYSIIFSGNLALQSFGREGESEWFLNSVPLAGWPVVWGKLWAVVLPTLLLMEALLAGTALATGLSSSAVLGLAVGAVFITFSASATGLFFSIRHCRYNPESPKGRISSGAAWLMYLLNMLFMVLIALGLVYLSSPAEIIAPLKELPPITFSKGFSGIVLYLFYLLTRPLLWPDTLRTVTGLAVSGGVWSAVFFGFLSATVRQSRKGFRVEIVTAGKKFKLR